MLENLKDLYVSYPFLPVDDAPEWFRHIKDVRLVVVLPAANPISEYRNKNNIQAWLTGIDHTHMVATFHVQCLQYGITAYTLTANLVKWESGSPAANSYVVIDDTQLADTSDGSLTPLPVLSDVAYELNPDVLIFMQEAPTLSYDQTAFGTEVHVANGNNVSVSAVTTGVSFLGGLGVGKGRYTEVPWELRDVAPAMQGLGARSINGMQDMVWLSGSFPLVVESRPLAGVSQDADTYQNGMRLVLKSEKSYAAN